MVMKKDLTDVSDADYSQRTMEFIYCPECEAEMGGTRGDYFGVPDDYVFVCECGNKDLQLVREIRKLRVIKD